MSIPAPAFNGNRRVPEAVNEPVKSYAPGTPERDELKAMLKTVAGERPEIPLVIGGEEIHTKDKLQAVMPHDHGHVLADVSQASAAHVQKAIEAAAAAWREWSCWSLEERALVILRAAELLAGPWRARVNAATMLGQSKTVQQAEIDAACELIDFWRFNARFAEELYDEQPLSTPGTRNTVDYRPLEGFVYAVTPFNFTAIGGNLPTAPALLGNVTLWKPASTSLLSNYYVMKVLEQAGMPPGVVNFVPGPAAEISKVALGHADLAGVHFTGSTEVFQSIWKTVGQGIAGYRSYPRLVGETGGKDFIIAHASADPEALATAIVRGAFEYQGQKCSALSRLYVSKSIWKDVKDRVTALMGELVMGDVTDFRTFMGAVIDKKAFDKIGGYLDDAKKDVDVVKGGGREGKKGYFIEPTLVETQDSGYKLMCDEIFGPVVAAYAFDDSKWEETLAILDSTSPYALTGAIWGRDRRAVQGGTAALRNAAGNFYINDKPTGSVVGQQPFGGARASGTNDKAGSKLNLTRWVSARAVKETFVPPTDHRYPNMADE